ncbi:MAG: serine/threonine-protein kinase [Gemmatimonadota bacterium]
MEDSRRWARIEEVFHQALEVDADGRERFVAHACEGDPALEARVRALLAAEDEAGGFLETPIARVNEASEAPDGERTVGVYRLVRPLGSGGMGDVFLGLQEGPDFRRYAAIKIVREGIGAGFAERFTRERAILAQLAHPGIARFLGGGTTEDGRPYFVMEHVEGERLDRYSDRRVLSLRERVELLRQVCLAVQHAHGNLVVHRDLKPSNILVTPEGVPKLLDFGIAKLLSDDQPEATRTGFRLATPEYAAPEQLRGDGVSTATDVYALGVLLYESLSGHRPFTAAEAAARAIEAEPAPPQPPSVMVGRFATRALPDGEEETVTPEDVSAKRRTEPGTLRRRLQGDLDNIASKALRFDPNERYVSAAALADDLERYLTGQPVRARADSFWYRSTKFVRRNRAASVAGAALTLTLIAATGVTLSQNRRIAAQAQRLSDERDRALAVQGFLLESFGAAGGDALAGDSLTVRQVLDGQAAQLETLYADDPVTRAEMMHVLADGYERLGALEPAERWAERAVEERRTLARGPIDPELARSLTLLGWVLHERNRLDEAEVPMREALGVWRALGSDSAGLSRTLNDLSGAVMNQGRLQEAETLATEALGIRRLIFPATDRAIAITANNLANIYALQGRNDEAVPLLDESVAILEASLGPDHRRTLNARRNLAALYGRMGDWERSAELAARVVVGFERLGDDDIGLARAFQVYGTALARTGEPERADSVLERGLAIARARVGDHDVTGALLLQRGALQLQRGQRLPALEHAREAVRLYDRLYDDHPQLAEALRQRGALAVEREEQTDSYRAAAEMLTRIEGETGQGAVRLTMSWARSLAAGGHPRQALELFTRLARTVPEAYGAEHVYAPAPYLGQAEAQAALGDSAAARAALAEAEQRMGGAADVPPNRQWLQRVQQALGGAPTAEDTTSQH